MKALPSRLPVLFCLCMVTALALAFSAPQAASIEVYGGGGGGGGGAGADTGALPGNGGVGGAGGQAVLNGFAGADGAIDAMDNSSPGGGGGGGSGGGVSGGGAGSSGERGQSPAGNPGAGGAGGAGAATGSPGSGNSGGAGGAGGAGITDTQPSAETAPTSISVIAGSGGNGGDGALFGTSAGGNGGVGGAANLTLTGATVTSAGAVLVQSGANGQAGTTVAGWGANGQGGAGGAASLIVQNTLIAPTISLTKQDGALTFTVTTLDVTTGNTTLTLTGTTAAGVNIGTVALSGGNTFTVTSANSGAGTFTNLDVTGAGGTLTAPATQLFSNVSLAGGSNFTSTNSLNFTNMRVLDQGAGYTGTLNAAGKTLTFDLPASLTPGQTMLNVTGNADITGTTVNLTYQTVRPIVQPGESLTLLAATSLTADQTGLTVQTASGDIYTLQVDNNQLLAMLQQISPNTPAYERLKAFAEGRTATLAFVNQGQDLILNQGFGSALMATRGPGFQLNAFAAGQGGWSRYNTGSHVDVSGASMLAGMALGNDLGYGRLTLGAFFEGGWGSYNSHNSFSNYASVKGDGDTSYYGGGILGRWDIPCGAYIDASARMGRARTDFNTDDIKYNGSNADFDSSAMYYGAHAGLGYQWSFSEQAMLDLSARFLWTRQASDSVDVHGDRVHFDDADSLRTRLGGRFNYAVTETITPYAGAYWEHEFDGRQRSNVNGVGIGSPSLRGDTGVGELGLSLTPSASLPLTVDLGVQGHVGQRQGVTGSLQVKFEF